MGEDDGQQAAARDAVEIAESAGGRRVVLGLTGPPGAGKSTLAEFIVDYARARMGDSWAAYFPMDGYHLSNAQLNRIGLQNRKGAPATFDVGGYVAMLSRLTADSGEDIYVPEYDRTLNEPIAARLLIPAAARLIVTEGNYLALDEPRWQEARRMIDQLWYVDAADSLREERLVARQLAGGRSEDAAREWVESSDGPNGELVKRSRANSDRTIAGRGKDLQRMAGSDPRRTIGAVCWFPHVAESVIPGSTPQWSRCGQGIRGRSAHTACSAGWDLAAWARCSWASPPATARSR